MNYKTTVNDVRQIAIDILEDGSVQVNGKDSTPDISEIREGVYHVISGTGSYNAEVIRYDADSKELQIRVNTNVYKVQVKDRFDLLLKELGLDTASSKKVSELKAPMPGLVVEVSVTEGMEVKKGDKLLVLEAMKMENILKSPADVTVKKIQITKGLVVGLVSTHRRRIVIHHKIFPLAVE